MLFNKKPKPEPVTFSTILNKEMVRATVSELTGFLARFNLDDDDIKRVALLMIRLQDDIEENGTYHFIDGLELTKTNTKLKLIEG